MDFSLFKRIINECARYRAYSIRISFRGEPFIHQDAVAMIRYAKAKGIKEVSSLTNNLALTPEMFKDVMEAGLDWLTISFDGLGETYEKIRQPAKFTESYEKIKAYKRIKEAARSVKPVIKIQSVWPAIKHNAQEYFDAFFPYVDDIAINPLIDYLHNDKAEDILYIPDFTCPVLFQRIVVGSDGIVPLCSNDEFNYYQLGDVSKESIYDLWHGTRMNAARALHRAHAAVGKLIPCKQCYLPRRTQPVAEDIGERRVYIDKYINRADEVGV
jgi:hypothetical protein